MGIVKLLDISNKYRKWTLISYFCILIYITSMMLMRFVFGIVPGIVYYVFYVSLVLLLKQIAYFDGVDNVKHLGIFNIITAKSNWHNQVTTSLCLDITSIITALLVGVFLNNYHMLSYMYLPVAVQTGVIMGTFSRSYYRGKNAIPKQDNI